MMTLPATHWNIHSPGPCPVNLDTPLWIVTKGSRGPIAAVAKDWDWFWEGYEPDHVLAYAPLVENPYDDG